MPKGKAISPDIQWIIIRMSTCLSVEDISMYTDLTIRSVKKILAHYEETSDVLIPKKLSGGPRRILDDFDVHVCTTLVSTCLLLNTSLSTSTERCKHLQIYILTSCVWNWRQPVECQCRFKPCGEPFGTGDILSRKCVTGTFAYRKLQSLPPQLTRIALERSEQKRAEFACRIGTYEPEQLVFVDESSVDRRTTYRGKAWSIRGTKAARKAFFCRGRRCVFILTLSYVSLSLLQILSPPSYFIVRRYLTLQYRGRRIRLGSFLYIHCPPP
jgi:hypothetical protein